MVPSGSPGIGIARREEIISSKRPQQHQLQQLPLSPLRSGVIPADDNGKGGSTMQAHACNVLMCTTTEFPVVHVIGALLYYVLVSQTEHLKG